MNNKIILGVSTSTNPSTNKSLKNIFYIDVFYKLKYSYLRVISDHNMKRFSFENTTKIPNVIETHGLKKIYGDNLND